MLLRDLQVVFHAEEHMFTAAILDALSLSDEPVGRLERRPRYQRPEPRQDPEGLRRVAVRIYSAQLRRRARTDAGRRVSDVAPDPRRLRAGYQVPVGGAIADHVQTCDGAALLR